MELGIRWPSALRTSRRNAYSGDDNAKITTQIETNMPSGTGLGPPVRGMVADGLSSPPPRCGGRDAREASWWNAGRRVDPWAYAYPGRAKSRNSRPGGYQGLQQQRRKSIGAGFGWRVGGEGVNSGCSLRLVPFCLVPYETVSMAPSWGTPDALGTFRWVGKSEFISGRPSRPAPHFPCLTQVKHQSRGANTSSFHRLQTLSTTLLVSQLERDLLR